MRIAVGPFIYKTVSAVPETQVALLLGASVVRGEPSPILARRADMTVALYESGHVSKILITGDSRTRSHDEVTPMREYLLAAGIPAKDIFLDHAGFDTYSSVYRSREIFRAQSLTIVTQDFHLPRALWVARRLGLNAYGVVAGADGSLYDYVREIPASVKALFDVFLGRQPQYLGPVMPLGEEVLQYE
jgi:SanA protein